MNVRVLQRQGMNYDGLYSLIEDKFVWFQILCGQTTASVQFQCMYLQILPQKITCIVAIKFLLVPCKKFSLQASICTLNL